MLIVPVAFLFDFLENFLGDCTLVLGYRLTSARYRRRFFNLKSLTVEHPTGTNSSGRGSATSSLSAGRDEEATSFCGTVLDVLAI